MPSNPRILFVTESFNVGGTETHLLTLLPELKARGFDVAAFCFSEAGTGAGRLRSQKISVDASPGIGDTNKRSWRAPFRMAGGSLKLFGLIRQFRPDIVHFFLPAPYLLGGPVAMAARVPIKIMSRRSLNDYQHKWPGAASAERILHRRMDAIMGNAHAITRELASEGVPEEKICLIHNGVSVPAPQIDRKEARRLLGVGEETLLGIVVANLHPYKGHADLIAALGDIADSLPSDWKVLLVGRDSGALRDIETSIARAKLDEHISLLGERSDIASLLAASDMSFLTPTRNEGFSNAILESMAARLPTIVTDVGGNAEAVVDGETGFVVAPHDPQALREALLKLMLNPDLRQAMGDAAGERAKAQFSLATQVDKYCRVYRDLLERHYRTE